VIEACPIDISQFNYDAPTTKFLPRDIDLRHGRRCGHPEEEHSEKSSPQVRQEHQSGGLS
jgi:hypothetical protein